VYFLSDKFSQERIKTISAKALRVEKVPDPSVSEGTVMPSIPAGFFFKCLEHVQHVVETKPQLNTVFRCVPHTLDSHPSLAGRTPTP